MRIVKYFKMTSLEYDLNSLNLGRSEISEVPMRPALEQNKKRYNSMEPALQEIQKAIALSTTDKSNHNSVLHSVIDEIIENMKNIDPLFKNIYNKKLYGGSYYDGLKLHAPDEYDLDLALKLPKKCNVRLEKSTFPGFVKIFADIESMKKDVNYKEFGNKRDERTSGRSHVAFMAKNDKCNANKFIVDSGASCHMTNNLEILEEMKVKNMKFTVANNQVMHGTALGNIRGEKFDLNDVTYVPELSVNLISVNKITENGGEVMFKKDIVVISKDSEEIIIGHKNKNGTFEVEIENKNDNILLTQEVWHKRMGHICNANLKKLRKMANGIDFKEANFDCEVCVKAKHTRDPFSGHLPKAKRILEIIHTDVCGPNSPTYDGQKYFITFIDDYTHYTEVYLFENKSEVAEIVRNYVTKVENEKQMKIFKIKCDGGTEYLPLIKFAESKGIILDVNCPYSSQLNGKAERMNRILEERTRALLFESNMKTEMWGEALRTATYLNNRTPSSILDVTPIEKWTGQRPDLSKIHTFGCVAYAKILTHLRKFEPRSQKYSFVGYGTNGYRLWDETKRKIIRSRDVKFFENSFENKEQVQKENGGIYRLNNDEWKSGEEEIDEGTPFETSRSMEKFIDDNHFLLSSKFRDWFEGLLNKAINNIYCKNGAKKFNLSKSGPAMTLKISIDGRTVCVDLVPAFIFVRKEDWPGSDFRSNPLTKKDEFLVVPKDPPKSCSKYNTSWRLSFQEQEKDIICGKNGLKDTIRLLKLLRSHQFKETMLASYYIKTVMMWLVDYVDDSFWQNSRSFIFMMGLKYFSKLLSQAEIPYYWNNKYNLLIGVNKTTISNWSNRIEKLIKTLENKLDAPNHELKHLIFDYFGMQKLKEPKEVQNGDDEKVVLEEVITRKTVAVTSESPSYKILVNSLQPPTSNENGEKDDKPKANSQLNFTQDSQLLIWKNISEYEAFGINVTRKLERMNKTQVIHAENLINKILMMGLLNQLTEDANNTIGEGDEPDTFIKFTPHELSLCKSNSSSDESHCCFN